MSKQEMTPERLRDVADVLDRVAKVSQQPGSAYEMSAMVRAWADDSEKHEVFQAEVVKILDRLEPKIERTANGSRELIAALERADTRAAELEESHEGYRVNAESDVRNLKDLLRRSYVNGCKMDYLQDDSIDAEVYEALGVANKVTPLSILARQIEEAEQGKEDGAK